MDEARARDAASAIEAQRLTSMRALPEVAAVSTVSAGMLDQRGNIPVQVSGVGATAGARSAVGWTVYTSPAIAEVLGLRLVEGAFPRDLPTADLTLVTVITRCLRERLFPDDAVRRGPRGAGGGRAAGARGGGDRGRGAARPLERPRVVRVDPVRLAARRARVALPDARPARDSGPR